MFEKDQKVWCAIYGAGVIVEIQHPSEGAYPIEVRFINGRNCIYTSDGKYCADSNIVLFPYPIEITKAVTKPSIEWSHVNTHFKWLAQDSNGMYHLYTDKPLQGNRQWTTNLPCTPATHFASFTPGTCDWRDSLVKRPS